MKTIFKYAATAALTGALALAAASPGEARNGRNAAAIGLGVGAAVAGAAIASSAYNSGYYGDPGYAYGPGYAYDPGYAYAPGYAYDDGYAYGSYAYAPAPAYGYYGDRWSRQHRTNNFSIDSQR
jgi:hypothetical protein